MTTTSNGHDPVLSATDFGPIVEANVDLRPLTVFVGPSNTGKSYLAVLICALHRFFSGHRIPGYWRRVRPPFLRPRRTRSSGKVTDVPKEALDAAFRWTEDVVNEAKTSGSAETVDITLPEHVAHLIRPILGDVEDMGQSIDGEITRCFGVEESKYLIRQPSKTDARIGLCRDVSQASERRPPFKYEFTVTRTKPHFTSFFSPETPLRIEVAGRASSIPRIRERQRPDAVSGGRRSAVWRGHRVRWTRHGARHRLRNDQTAWHRRCPHRAFGGGGGWRRTSRRGFGSDRRGMSGARATGWTPWVRGRLTRAPRSASRTLDSTVNMTAPQSRSPGWRG